MKVRVKHKNDPSVTLNIGTGPDEGGGYVVSINDLEQVRAHGFEIAHLEAAEAAEEPETEKTDEGDEKAGEKGKIQRVPPRKK